MPAHIAATVYSKSQHMYNHVLKVVQQVFTCLMLNSANRVLM